MELCEIIVFNDEIAGLLSQWNISISSAQLDQLRAHFEAVVEANRVMNLTRITNPVDAAVKHYVDSFALLPWAVARKIESASLLDVGTGAGFPALPLAVLRPAWAITAIDATRKKIDFLNRTAEALGLTNLRAIHAHSDHWKERGTFQLVTLRAVTKLAQCMESCAEYLARGGWLVVYKTASLDADERTAASAMAARLRLKAEQPYAYELKLGDEVLRRALFVFRRPRRASTTHRGDKHGK